MTDEERTKIEKLIDQLSCSKDFRCAQSGFERLCKARDIGLERFLECAEKKAWGCKFAFPFGDAYFCRCPLRVYIAKNLKK
jgi:hypothetical protein